MNLIESRWVFLQALSDIWQLRVRRARYELEEEVIKLVDFDDFGDQRIYAGKISEALYQFPVIAEELFATHPGDPVRMYELKLKAVKAYRIYLMTQKALKKTPDTTP